uniref:Uncharacterized protein n=1 Tax=viral metagenome TaxID=1070528 RepID=A0A6M3LKW9_9ZZZZ
MITNDSRVVLFDSDDAAHFQTGISGWVSRHGRFMGNDERTARYDGCTHTRCEDCGEPVDRGRLICPKCNEARDVKRYAAMPKEEWNGKGMLYSETTDKYFSDWDEIEEYCADEEIAIDRLRLIICEPNYLPLLDPSDYGCDEMAEDGELPDAVIHAIEDFNKVIKAAPPISWTPGKKAAISNV